MKACPKCGSVAVKPNDLGGDTCQRPGCDYTATRAFPHLYQKATPRPELGVGVFAPGCYQIQPAPRNADGHMR